MGIKFQLWVKDFTFFLLLCWMMVYPMSCLRNISSDVYTVLSWWKIIIILLRNNNTHREIISTIKITSYHTQIQCCAGKPFFFFLYFSPRTISVPPKAIRTSPWGVLEKIINYQLTLIHISFHFFSLLSFLSTPTFVRQQQIHSF